MTALAGGCIGVLPATRRRRRIRRLSEMPPAERDQVLAELLAGVPGYQPSTRPSTQPSWWTYLLHFIDPADGAPARIGHAGHYLGKATDVPRRLAEHRAGTAAGGARLPEVVRDAGLDWVVARLWPADVEAQLKSWRVAPRLCLACDPAGAARRGLRLFVVTAWDQTCAWRWAS